MGNCIRHESPMMWGGEDWGSPVSDHRMFDEMSEKDMMGIEEKELILIQDERKSYVATNKGKYGCSTSSNNNNDNNSNEVKIKISKKQLEELLGKVDVNDMSVQQVLAQFINVGNNNDSYHQTTHQLRSWRPVLQSIPEVN